MLLTIAFVLAEFFLLCCGYIAYTSLRKKQRREDAFNEDIMKIYRSLQKKGSPPIALIPGYRFRGTDGAHNENQERNYNERS